MARVPGASSVSITVPSVRNEIAVCLTVTVIAALSAFDVIYISTNGGPGFATLVPGSRSTSSRSSAVTSGRPRPSRWC